MITPDWSKAPEGATHWGPEAEGYLECWYKFSDDGWRIINPRDNRGWLKAFVIRDGLVPRPHAEDKIIPDTGEAPKSSAHSILDAAAGHMQDRAATYDKPEGERSMGATVEAFRAVTGHDLTEEQGWLFMALLKAVRSQQGDYRADSYEDGAAYFALAGESSARERAAE